MSRLFKESVWGTEKEERFGSGKGMVWQVGEIRMLVEVGGSLKAYDSC
jgi:hypothetical protein